MVRFSWPTSALYGFVISIVWLYDWSIPQEKLREISRRFRHTLVTGPQRRSPVIRRRNPMRPVGEVKMEGTASAPQHLTLFDAKQATAMRGDTTAEITVATMNW